MVVVVIVEVEGWVCHGLLQMYQTSHTHTSPAADAASHPADPRAASATQEGVTVQKAVVTVVVGSRSSIPGSGATGAPAREGGIGGSGANDTPAAPTTWEGAGRGHQTALMVRQERRRSNGGGAPGNAGAHR